jgi:predicted ATPase
MRISRINLRNFRSFEKSGDINLSDINILIGENNSGKSSILRAIHHVQHGLTNIFADVRVNSSNSEIILDFQNSDRAKHWQQFATDATLTFKCNIASPDRREGECSYNMITTNPANIVTIKNSDHVLFPNTEPNHFIVPFFSKRKASYYQEEVKESQLTQITSDTSNLAAKLSRIGNLSFPGHRLYAETCKAILGHIITAVPSQNGQRPGVYLPDSSIIYIDQMGEGVPNIVFLLASLALSKGKLFLIEEPENDLHPNALKALLDLIKESSKHNQFVISTHSNIVVTHLCAEKNSKLFKITCEKGLLPNTASIEEIGDSPRERVQVLQELGYSFSDYDLWEGWLLLEESSAERIIRDYLIPWFAPKLHRIKTVAANGINNVEPTFNDLFRVVLFTHLQQAYSGLAWVRVDGDDVGIESIEKLKAKFPSIPQDHFSTFDKPQFELYYPNQFKKKADAALTTQDKKRKQEAKRELLEEVISWIEQDLDRAKIEFEQSASSVITELKLIEQQFLKQKNTIV